MLELLRVRLLVKYPVSLALPKSHPHADKAQIALSLLKEEPFIGLNRMYPNYGDLLLKSCRRVGFKPRIAKEADGAASTLALAPSLSLCLRCYQMDSEVATHFERIARAFSQPVETVMETEGHGNRPSKRKRLQVSTTPEEVRR